MATGRIGTTPVLQVRWSKAPSAGTTSLSGLDDNSVSLVYSVGYEQVYRNGVLLSRGNDYTATNGTTITLIDATITGDIIEVFANATIPLTDTYSQTVANGKFINNTLTTTTGDIIYASAANTPARLGIGSTDQVLKVSGGIPAWGAAPSPTAQAVAVDNGNPATDHTLTSGVYTTLLFNNELIDTDSFHSTTTNTGRLTVPTGLGGKYLLNFVGYVNPNTAGDFVAKFQINGNDKNRVSFKFGPSEPFSPSISSIVSLNAGDYVEILCYQNTGVNQLLSTNQYGQFAMFRIGA